MKTLVSFILCLQVSNSYSQKMDSDYYKEAVDFYNEKRYSDAADRFQYIVDHYAESDYYEDALFNLGGTFMRLEKFPQAISTFHFILNSAINDATYVGGGDIMSNPFQNYKHSSSYSLYLIYKKLEKYDSALTYLSYSDTLYPLQASCGNALMEELVYNAIDYSELYQKMGDKSMAISKILQYVWGPYEEDEQLLAILKTLLQGESGVLAQFDDALKKMTLVKKKGECECNLRFRETDLIVPSEFIQGNPCSRKKTTKAIKESKLYQMIQSLEKKQ